MAITDINISETLDVGAPSIKYTGNLNPSIPPWERDSYIDPADDVIDEEATIKVASNESNDAWLENRIEELMEMGLDWGAAASQASKELREGNVGPQDLASGGRAHLGLGSFIKKIGKAAKSVVKSPLGKAAILGLGGYYLGGGNLFGAQRAGMSGFKWGNMPGMSSLFGTAGKGGGALPWNMTPGKMWQPGAEGLLGKLGMSKGYGGGLTALGYGTAALGAGMGAQMFENMQPDEIKALRNNPEALRSYLKQYHTNTNPEKSEKEVDLWVEQNMYSTGGRVGFDSGSNGKFSFYLDVPAKGFNQALKEDREFREKNNPNGWFKTKIKEKIKPYTKEGRGDYKKEWLHNKGLDMTVEEWDDKPLKEKLKIWFREGNAQGGRTGFADRGTIKDMTISNNPNDPRNLTTVEIISIIKGGRSTPEMFEELRVRGIDGVKLLELVESGKTGGSGDVAYSFDERLVDNYDPETGTSNESFLMKMRESNPDVYGKYNKPREHLPIAEPKNYPENGFVDEPKWMKAKGGRIGFAFGPDQTAQAAGIMGQLPVRNNAAGVEELDLRDSGGFVPPVGIKEKADDIPAMLSNNEFVMTADAVRAAGGGSVEKGAQVMYDQMKNLENRIA